MPSKVMWSRAAARTALSAPQRLSMCLARRRHSAACARDHRILGVVYRKDISQAQGTKGEFRRLGMGIKTVMITGDNRWRPPPSPPGRRGRLHRRGAPGQSWPPSGSIGPRGHMR